MTLISPDFTFNAAGNVRASASLAASASANYDVDYSAVIEAILTFKNTPGASISATRGVRLDFYQRYGNGPTTPATPYLSTVMPSETASTTETATVKLPPGKYNVAVTNLDAAQAVTLEISADTWVLEAT